jgi:hypothetical protein
MHAEAGLRAVAGFREVQRAVGRHHQHQFGHGEEYFYHFAFGF